MNLTLMLINLRQKMEQEEGLVETLFRIGRRLEKDLPKVVSHGMKYKINDPLLVQQFLCNRGYPVLLHKLVDEIFC